MFNSVDKPIPDAFANIKHMKSLVNEWDTQYQWIAANEWKMSVWLGAHWGLSLGPAKAVASEAQKCRLLYTLNDLVNGD